MGGVDASIIFGSPVRARTASCFHRVAGWTDGAFASRGRIRLGTLQRERLQYQIARNATCSRSSDGRRRSSPYYKGRLVGSEARTDRKH